MADTTKRMDARTLQRKESIGTDGQGKELFKTKSFTNINKTISDADFEEMNKLIANLSDHRVAFLYEKITNTFVY